MNDGGQKCNRKPPLGDMHRMMQHILGRIDGPILMLHSTLTHQNKSCECIHREYTERLAQCNQVHSFIMLAPRLLKAMVVQSLVLDVTCTVTFVTLDCRVCKCQQVTKLG